MAKALDIIQISGTELGIELNIRKTEIVWPSCNGNKNQGGLFPLDIRRLIFWVKWLGGVVIKIQVLLRG